MRLIDRLLAEWAPSWGGRRVTVERNDDELYHQIASSSRASSFARTPPRRRLTAIAWAVLVGVICLTFAIVLLIVLPEHRGEPRYHAPEPLPPPPVQVGPIVVF